jgi:uncharacterized protein YciI
MRTFLFALFCSFSFSLLAQNVEYDAELALELGADEYGMKTYIFVILKTGPAEIADKDALSKMFEGHMANIRKLVESGQMVVAGPFGNNAREYRGMFILDVETPEEAEKLLNQDPTIANGVFTVEMTPWYGSAALPTYLENHKKIEKTQP